MTKLVTGVILAGGQSRRMGTDKAWLPLGGQPMIARICERLRPLCDELLIVTNAAARFAGLGAVVVEDLVPGAHALGGIYTGLTLAAHDTCFVTACDAPFLHPALVRWLLQIAGDWDLVVPRTARGLQPLHAVYRRACLPAVAAQLQQAQWDVQRLIGRVRTQIIEPDLVHHWDPTEESFRNLNTPQEYADAVAARSLPAPCRMDVSQGVWV